MAEIILVVEDVPEEQTRAKDALVRHGFKAVVAGTLHDALRIWDGLKDAVSGVITDLHFPERSEGRDEHIDSSRPCGIAIAAEAVRRGVPVVVCSNIDHHFADYLRIVIDVLSVQHPLRRIPFIMDAKDWDRAATELRKLITKREVS